MSIHTRIDRELILLLYKNNNIHKSAHWNRIQIWIQIFILVMNLIFRIYVNQWSMFQWNSCRKSSKLRINKENSNIYIQIEFFGLEFISMNEIKIFWIQIHIQISIIEII